MGGHHLILGQLTDYISGATLDDTLDERHRQMIGRFLVERKGYLKQDIVPRQALVFHVGNTSARLRITYVVRMRGHLAMLIQYGPGSLVTRHRPALAMGRLATSRQIPVVVVTNGEQADILDGTTGRVEATGLDGIPSREALAQRTAGHDWSQIPADRLTMEARVLMAYEVDDRCPCDDSVCAVDPREPSTPPD